MKQTTTRRTVLLVAAAVLVVAGTMVGTWFAALSFVSPEQRAAAASPPPPRPVVASVTRGDLVDFRTLPAEVVSTQSQSLPVLTRGDADRTVVTGVLATSGETATPGTVLLETNGAPVFVMASSFPFYRDLGVGDEGPDVKALQENLVSLGLLSEADGDFGERTADAVAALFDRAGYTAPYRHVATSPGTDALTVSPSAAARGEATAFLPLSSVITAAALPALVRQVPAEGEIVTDGTTVAVAAGTAEVRASVPDSLVQEIRAGLHAQITMPDGTDVAAAVEKIHTIAGESGAQTTVTLRRDDGAATAAELIGSPVTVRITVATIAEDALIVPLIAVSTHADESAVVLVEQDDGSFAQTPVTVIARLGGSAALETDGALRPDDRVKVG